MGKDVIKEGTVAVRLSQDEIDKLDIHTQGQVSRSTILRMLVQEFLEKPPEKQRELLVKRLFGK